MLKRKKTFLHFQIFSHFCYQEQTTVLETTLPDLKFNSFWLKEYLLIKKSSTKIPRIISISIRLETLNYGVFPRPSKVNWIHAEIKTFNCWDVSARIRASQQVVFVYHLQPRSCYHLAHETRRVCCFLPVLAVYGISWSVTIQRPMKVLYQNV